MLWYCERVVLFSKFPDFSLNFSKILTFPDQKRNPLIFSWPEKKKKFPDLATLINVNSSERLFPMAYNSREIDTLYLAVFKMLFPMFWSEVESDQKFLLFIYLNMTWVPFAEIFVSRKQKWWVKWLLLIVWIDMYMKWKIIFFHKNIKETQEIKPLTVSWYLT